MISNWWLDKKTKLNLFIYSLFTIRIRIHAHRDKPQQMSIFYYMDMNWKVILEATKYTTNIKAAKWNKNSISCICIIGTGDDIFIPNSFVVVVPVQHAISTSTIILNTCHFIITDSFVKPNGNCRQQTIAHAKKNRSTEITIDFWTKQKP